MNDLTTVVNGTRIRFNAEERNIVLKFFVRGECSKHKEFGFKIQIEISERARFLCPTQPNRVFEQKAHPPTYNPIQLTIFDH